MFYVGIDISKAKFDIAVRRDSKCLNKAFTNNEAGYEALLTWLHRKGIILEHSLFGMEATSTYYENLANYLHRQGWRVSVINPLQINAYAKAQMVRQKTDKADAKTIAHYLETQQPRQWEPPAAEIRELQRLLARLDALQNMRVQELNRQHEAKGLAHESIERILSVLNGEIAAIEKRINEHIDKHPGLRQQSELLQTIPAVGNKLSAYFLAWLPIRELSDVRQAVAYIGLSPRAKESGSSVRGKRVMCKQGNARLRKMLYMPALSAMRCNVAAQAMAQRLKSANKPGKLIVGALMRKLVHWMYGVLKSGMPFDENRALAKA